jgi:hypothetical protein
MLSLLAALPHRTPAERSVWQALTEAGVRAYQRTTVSGLQRVFP